MNNLEELFTLKGSFSEGNRLNQFTHDTRTWLDRLRRETRDPEYRLHQTVAGFPVILPHIKSGELFVPQKTKENGTVSIRRGRDETKLSYGFLLDCTTEYKIEEDNLLLGSHIRKDYRSFPKKMPGEVLVGHLVNPHGQIVCVRLDYFLAGRRNVSFNIHRDKEGGKISATLSTELLTKSFYDNDGKVNISPLDLEIPFIPQVDYQKSLQNLTGILQKEVFTESDMLNLYKLNYLCLSPEMRTIGKKLLN